jgi:hypothetical protein
MDEQYHRLSRATLQVEVRVQMCVKVEVCVHVSGT